MKKGYLFILILTLASGLLSVNAQLSASIGLKAGAVLANQYYRIAPIDYRMKTRIAIGPGASLFIRLSRQSPVSFQAEVGYAMKGFRSSTRSVTVNHSENNRITENLTDPYVSRFHYLTASPMARIQLVKGSRGIYVILGPRLDYLLQYDTSSETPLETVHELTAGATIGSGLEFRPGKIGYFAEFQYQPDISTVNGTDPLRVRNYAFVISTGIRF